jgi:hypothetical protein
MCSAAPCAHRQAGKLTTRCHQQNRPLQVSGNMRWCLLSTMSLHPTWFVSAFPDLLRAGRLVVVHDAGPAHKDR